MEQLNIDCGMESFALPGGVLRFNPTDPNLYARFLGMETELDSLKAQLEQQVDRAESARQVLEALSETDRQFKALLTRVFQSDFDRLLGGVHLLAIGENGLTVGENLIKTLEPVLTGGAERFTQTQTQLALEKARQRRGNL